MLCFDTFGSVCSDQITYGCPREKTGNFWRILLVHEESQYGVCVYVCVSVCLCLRTTTFEMNDL